MVSCALLKWFKLYFISTALFTSNSSLYTDGKNPVAITHEITHRPLHTHYEFVILRNPSYRECFMDYSNHNVVLATPSVGLEIWKDRIIHAPTPAVAKGTFAPPPITIKGNTRSIRPVTRASNTSPESSDLPPRRGQASQREDDEE